MHSYLNAIRAFDVYILLGLSALWLTVFSYAVSISKRLKRVTRRQGAKLNEGSIGEVTEWLNEHTESIDTLRRRIDDMDADRASRLNSLAGCLQRVGMVRFNAFDDIGGEQSFALALLDANNNGVVISSLYGRQDARLYAKGIVNGEGERPLSTEEQQALSNALAGRGVLGPVRTTAGR